MKTNKTIPTKTIQLTISEGSGQSMCITLLIPRPIPSHAARATQQVLKKQGDWRCNQAAIFSPQQAAPESGPAQQEAPAAPAAAICCWNLLAGP